MKQKLTTEFSFSTSINSFTTKDDFIIELFPCDENTNDETTPEKVIHNFDELIDFFESLETDELESHSLSCIGKK